MVFPVNKFFYYSFMSILLSVFLFGGFIQYFIGVSSTGYSLIILSSIYLLIFIDLVQRQKVLLTKVGLLFITFIILVLLSGLVNKSSIFKTLLYLIFPLTPLGVFYLLKILEKRAITTKRIFFSFFRFVTLVQLPIILIQKYGFDYLIGLNNSTQDINEYDFMFGSFFIRADHSLGFLILLYILNIIFRIKRKEITTPWILLSYLTLTIFVMESNLTKLMLILVVGYYLFLWFYSKVNLLGVFIMVFVGFFLFQLSLTVGPINDQYTFFKEKYTTKSSAAAFEKGYAKRPQVVIAYATSFPLKWIGDGPYDYFNIFKGEFKNTKHFSQLIWIYNDLGILGLFLVLILSYAILKTLNLDRSSFVLLIFVFFGYLFLTNIYSDLAMIISLLILVKKNKK